MEKKVIELFAGVGGFRVGLNEIEEFDENGKAIEKNNFEFVWANQWEPATRAQYAFDCYQKRFGENPIKNSNVDISLVDKKQIPDHSLLCGGFPCQDYSVAHSLASEKGIEGKKGVLWWQIRDILDAKKTPFVFLENVDRLIKSPAKQRGRDFGIMLRCFADLGYTVEWRVINAAEYGFPQRRRRIYIFAYKNTTKFAKAIKKKNVDEILFKSGIFATTFPVEQKATKIKEIDLYKSYDNLLDVSDKFAFRFENSGILLGNTIYTSKLNPITVSSKTLSEVIVNDAPEECYLDENRIKKFEYLRGRKKILRTSKSGHNYYYSEGAMSPVDRLDLPGRTMLTSEGTTNRSTHIIEDPITKRIRLLTPVECERLNQFPDNWTNSGMPFKKRYFMMGNALVCGIIKKLGKVIKSIIEKE